MHQRHFNINKRVGNAIIDMSFPFFFLYRGISNLYDFCSYCDMLYTYTLSNEHAFTYYIYVHRI